MVKWHLAKPLKLQWKSPFLGPLAICYISQSWGLQLSPALPFICSISPSITTPLFHVPAPLMDDVPKYHLSPVVHLCFIQFCHKYKVFHQVEIGCPFFRCPAIAPLRRLIIQKNCKRFELANCWDVWSYSYNFFWVNEIPLIGILFNDSEWTNLFFD